MGLRNNYWGYKPTFRLLRNPTYPNKAHLKSELRADAGRPEKVLKTMVPVVSLSSEADIEGFILDARSTTHTATDGHTPLPFFRVGWPFCTIKLWGIDKRATNRFLLDGRPAGWYQGLTGTRSTVSSKPPGIRTPCKLDHWHFAARPGVEVMVASTCTVEGVHGSTWRATLWRGASSTGRFRTAVAFFSRFLPACNHRIPGRSASVQADPEHRGTSVRAAKGRLFLHPAPFVPATPHECNRASPSPNRREQSPRARLPSGPGAEPETLGRVSPLRLTGSLGPFTSGHRHGRPRPPAPTPHQLRFTCHDASS